MNHRQQAKAATRQRMIAAGNRVFEKLGYDKADVRAIAADAGMSTGALYSVFDTGKPALYAAIYGHLPVTPEEGRKLRAEVERLKALVPPTPRPGHIMHRPLCGGEPVEVKGAA